MFWFGFGFGFMLVTLLAAHRHQPANVFPADSVLWFSAIAHISLQLLINGWWELSDLEFLEKLRHHSELYSDGYQGWKILGRISSPQPSLQSAELISVRRL